MRGNREIGRTKSSESRSLPKPLDVIRKVFCCGEQIGENSTYERITAEESNNQELEQIPTKIGMDYKEIKDMRKKIHDNKNKDLIADNNKLWNIWNHKLQRGELNEYLTEEIKKWRETETEALMRLMEKLDQEYEEGKTEAPDMEQYIREKSLEKDKLLKQKTMDYQEKDMKIIFKEIKRRFQQENEASSQKSGADPLAYPGRKGRGESSSANLLPPTIELMQKKFSKEE